MRHHRLRIELVSGPTSLVPIAVLITAVGFVFFTQPVRGNADDPGAESTPASTTNSDSVARGRLVLAQRVLAQDQGDWQVDYAFRNLGAEPVVLQPQDVAARVEGWLSNSRIAAHASPRRAACVVDGQASAVAFAEVIASPEESRRCRERVALWITPDPVPGSPETTDPRANPPLGSTGKTNGSPRPQPLALVAVTVEAGGLVRVRLRFEHQHVLHGDYDPLLGRRDLELRLGSLTFRDALPLDREQYLAMPKGSWPEPPDDRKDARHFVTGPDSLHLDADLPGGNYFRFPERKVRYATRMRLRFWYRVAPGTEGELHARIAQYRESPESYKVLADGARDIPLTAVGHWVRFDQIIRTEAEATTFALDFRISPCDVGEAWVDDVTLEPADAPAGGP